MPAVVLCLVSWAIAFRSASSWYCGIRASANRCQLMCMGVGGRVGFPAGGPVRPA
jgi:hypothetical protein